MNDFVPSIPDTLGDRLRWLGGSFHASAELKGSPEFDDLLARYAEQMGAAIVPCKWYSPNEFEQNFNIRFSNGEADGWVESYVMDLLRRAHRKKVSDIHINNRGPYAQKYICA